MDLEKILDSLERLARKPAAFILVCAFCLLWVMKAGWDPVTNPQNVFDSYSYYYAAKAINQGANPYDDEMLKAMGKSEGHFKVIFPYLYPPLLAGLWRPLTLLSPLQAHKALIIANLFLMALDFFLLYKIIRPRRHPHALFLTFLLFQPLNFTLVMMVKLGQINPLVMLLILLCLYFHLRSTGIASALENAPRNDSQEVIVREAKQSRYYETLSAVSLALATLIKMTPGILLLYFLLFYPRRRQYLGKLAAAMAGFVLLSFLVAPPVDWIYFVQSTLSGPPFKTVGSFWGQLLLFSQISPFLDEAKIWIYLALSLVLVIFSIRSLRHEWGSQRPFYAFSLLILLTIFLSPLTWYHHYYFCLLTFFYIPVYLWDRGRSSAFMGYITMVGLMLVNIPKPLAQFTGDTFVLMLSILKTLLTFTILIMTIAIRPAVEPDSSTTT